MLLLRFVISDVTPWGALPVSVVWWVGWHAVSAHWQAGGETDCILCCSQQPRALSLQHPTPVDCMH